MKQYQYDYYRIDLRDLLGDFTDEELADFAITQAQEDTRLYCIPAEWRAEQQEPGLFIVRRKRNYHAR